MYFTRRLIKLSAGGGVVSFVAFPFLKTDTQFHYKETAFNKQVLSKSDQYLKAYMPGFGLSGKVRQVLFELMLSKDNVTPVVYERANLIMSDGGTVSVDWARPGANKGVLITPSLETSPPTAKRVCFICPGLSGGSDRGYVKSLVKTLLSDGFEVAVFHNRGVSDTPYTSLEFADLTRNEELNRALEFVKEKAGPGAELCGIGLSMGANVLMRIAGIQGRDFPLKAIVAVNNPFDIWLTINLMRGSPYEKHLAKELISQQITRSKYQISDEEKQQMQKMIAHFNLNMDAISKAETWRELDEQFTIKIHPQFKSVINYYNAASCLDWVEHIAVPTLVLHSQDDPIVPVDCVPIDECMANEHIITALTRRGSHVCYFMGIGNRRWYTHACSEFLQNSLRLIKEKQADHQTQHQTITQYANAAVQTI